MIVESYEDVIILSGALRSNFWETIHTAISLTLKRHPTGVIVDCSGISQCTESGAETFRDAMEFIQRHDARIIVAAVPDHVLDVLKLVPEVRSQLAIAKTVEDARRSLDLLLPTPEKKKREPVVHTHGRVLTVLTGGKTDSDALHMAWHIADTQLAEVHLVFVVIVPRHLPLQTPMPESEQAALDALESGRAFLNDRGIPSVSHLERSRDLAAALDSALAEIDAIQVVVPLPNGEATPDACGKVVNSVLAKIKRPVIFVRGFPAVEHWVRPR